MACMSLLWIIIALCVPNEGLGGLIFVGGAGTVRGVRHFYDISPGRPVGYMPTVQ